MDKEIQRLLSLLDEAADEMRSYGDESTLSYFDTCKDGGNFLADIVNKIKNEKMEEISKLPVVHVGTGIWDDSGGSQEIANEICEILDRNYKPDS